jgi:hypothetical protein
VTLRTKLFSLLLCTLAVLCSSAGAATRNAASCSASAVQSAINAANTGDTVTIPAGTCSWTSGVSIPSSKGITVQGAGSGRIVAYSSSTLSIGTGSKTLTISTAHVGHSLSLVNGQSLKISELGNRQNYMSGTVASYNGSSLTMNIASAGGACGNSSGGISPSNCKRWIVSTPPSTVLVNNLGGGYMFDVTENGSAHTSLSGFKIASGSGGGGGVRFNKGGGQAILLHDCWIEQPSSGDSVRTSVNRGVIWNCSFDATPFSMAPLAIHLTPFDEAAWTQPSYWGMQDTDGQHNFYVEDSDFHAYLNSTDNDEGARSVFRYNVFNNAGFGTHGADSSPISQRYFEYYNNVGNFNSYNDGTTFNTNWWMFVRGGSFIVHDNILPEMSSTDYGKKADVNMVMFNLDWNAGPNPCWGAGISGVQYHGPQQVGMGYVTGKGTDGEGRSTYDFVAQGWYGLYVGDPEPAYMWNNKRSAGSSYSAFTNIGIASFGSGGGCSGSDKASDYIQSGRDFYNTPTTGKPGYTPYTHPHPLTQQAQSTPPPVGVSPPSALSVTVQ